MKRALDIALSALGLVLLTPVFAAVALGLRREGAGPVLFRQVRVGRGFRPFRILKFRTMVPGAERMGPGITPGKDPRVTRFGAFLRWTKLDELPQLWNVLCGDMSLVGPRPELPHYARMFEDDYREILRVRPGITDLASLAYRDEAGRLDLEPDPERAYVETILPDKIRLARTYVSRASFAYDLRIIGETMLLLAFPARALDRMLERFASAHRQIALLVQATLAAAANLLAMWLIYDGGLTRETLDLVLLALPALLAVRTLWHVVFHLDRDRWRYVGLREIGDVVAATLLGTGTFWALTQLVPVYQGYPRAIIIVDGVLRCCCSRARASCAAACARSASEGTTRGESWSSAPATRPSVSCVTCCRAPASTTRSSAWSADRPRSWACGSTRLRSWAASTPSSGPSP